MFVAESSESFRVADREQFYFSASRFKQALSIYTDDKNELLEAVRKSSHRPSVTDLISHEILAMPETAMIKSPFPSMTKPDLNDVQKNNQRRASIGSADESAT